MEEVVIVIKANMTELDLAVLKDIIPDHIISRFSGTALHVTSVEVMTNGTP